ncbi:MAG: class I SAM-dependent methyltransferase [bacterium]|nr:class I SAM-dependent methyltransferase [bacterium]MDZ4295804.1 class I SAM-dependent methyltransferase [Patescibacteria group bacterium]
MEPFPYDKAEYEDIPCNLCGERSNFKVLSRIDRYGLAARACLCRRCGLMFISPRMTKEWYARFYEVEYRALLARYKRRGEVQDLEKLFYRQERAGVALAGLVRPYICQGLTIDVGSGTGGVLAGFKKVNPALEMVGIEPALEEASYANRRGIKTYATLFENFNEALPAASNVMSTANLNHLLDPRAFLVWAHRQLRDDGRLILAVQNFRLSAKQAGRVVPQIDHVFMFTPETLRSLVESSGFRVIFFDNPERRSFGAIERMASEGLGTHMKLVARKDKGIETPSPILKARYRRVAWSMSTPNLKLVYYGKYLPYVLQRRLRARFNTR